MKNTILSIFSGMMLGTLLVIGVFTVLYFQSSDSVVLAQSMPGEKIENNNILKSFKGIPIALITAGIMALIFTRLTPCKSSKSVILFLRN